MGELLAYLNGEYIPHSECKLPVFDLGIVLGAAVTDFTRTFNGVPFRIEDHVERLYRSCKYTYLKPKQTKEETIEISKKLVEHNSKVMPGNEWGIIYYITGGVKHGVRRRRRTAGRPRVHIRAAHLPDAFPPLERHLHKGDSLRDTGAPALSAAVPFFKDKEPQPPAYVGRRQGSCAGRPGRNGAVS